MRVFITMPRSSVVRSTDRGYLYKQLTRLGDEHPIDFVGNDGLASRWYDDFRHVGHRALHAVGRHVPPIGRWVEREHPWSLVALPGDVDLAYAYGQFPRVVDARRARLVVPERGLPIVWQQTFAPVAVDVDVPAWRAAMRAARADAVSRADRIVVPSGVSLQHLADMFPEARAKSSILPYYLPDLEPVDDSALAGKGTRGGPLRVLFVGKEAHRKGLPTLVEAWAELPEATRRELQVTVVSAFVDGVVALPAGWRHETFVKDLYGLMGTQDVLVFPTRREAYGLVLVEAMARGMAIVTTRAPIQADIVGQGGGDFIDPSDAPALARSLRRLAHDRAEVATVARANLCRFRAEYWHRAVGLRHFEVFRSVIG